MRSSRRRSMPAVGDGIQGSVSVEITTRWVKSALTSWSDIVSSFLEFFGERPQVHLMGPSGRMLCREIEIGTRDGARIHPPRGRTAEAPIGLRFVDQPVEHDMGDMHAL